MTTLQNFLDKLNTQADTVRFEDCIQCIDSLYNFEPTEFKNGDLINIAGQNSGSCKIFAFAQMTGLTASQTLNCFGDYYRVDVLQHPGAGDHQNIRNFMLQGWDGIRFHGTALTALK